MQVITVAVAVAVVLGMAHSKPDGAMSSLIAANTLDVVQLHNMRRDTTFLGTRQVFGSCTVEQFTKKLGRIPGDCAINTNITDISNPAAGMQVSWKIICEPRCGNPLVRAYMDCDLDIYVQYRYGCSLNEDGERCYETFDTLLPQQTEVINNCLPQTTDCSSTGMNALTTFHNDNGCCVYTFSNSLSNAVWSNCNVETPDMCDLGTSTLTGSVKGIVMAAKVLFGAVLLATMLMN